MATRVTGRAVAGNDEAGPGPRAVRDRLLVNASALMLSSVATGAFGLVYWIVAGRMFPAAEVGRASALISTATMLSSVACLSLGGSYQRFLPLAGRRASAALAGGYGVTAVFGVLLAAAFAWSPLSDKLLYTAGQRLAFPAVVAVFTVFALTDPILTGLRKAPAVAAKNIAAAAGKVVPLFFLGATGTAMGIVASWTGVSLVVVAVFVVVAFRESRSRTAPPALPPGRELLSFQGAFLLMMLVSTALPLALPLIVVDQLGTADNAYFNLAFTMYTASGLLRAGMGSAFIVEAATPGADRPALLRRMLPMYGGVSLLTAAGLAAGGPIVLAAAGPEYLAAAWPVMVIMGGVALIDAVVTGYYLLAQLLRRLRLMIVSQAVIVTVTLTGSLLLLPRFGITGAALANAAAVTLALGLVAAPLRRGLRELRDTSPWAHTTDTRTTDRTDA